MALAKSNTNDLASLFKEGKYKIPVYQRRYSWEEPQQLALFNDLLEAKQHNSHHFLGTLSLELLSNKGMVSEYNIIDGQQRFTTLMILYSVLSQKTNKSEYINSIKIGTGYILESINQVENEFLESLLSSSSIPISSSLSQLSMQTCKKLFESKIRDISSIDAEKFCDFILNNSMFLIYLLDDRKKAIKMFEIINDRGLQLKYFDKIKSYFLYLSNFYLSDEINLYIEEKFNEIYSFFDSELANISINNDENLLLYHYLSNPLLFPNWSYTKPTESILVDIKKMISELPEENKRRVKTKEFIENYLEDLIKFIKAVKTINERIEEIPIYCEFFQLLSPGQRMYPLSIRLEMLDRLTDNLDLLEKIEFYLKYRRDPKKDIFNLIKEIFDLGSASNSEFRKLMNNELYNVYQAQGDVSEILNQTEWGLKYCLYLLNKKQNDQIFTFVDYRNFELEHIFSQNPSFPVLNYGFPEEEYSKLIEKIGNFTLLEKSLNGNGEASNKTPTDKINFHYCNSNFKNTTKIRTTNLQDIEIRTNEILDFARDYFSFNYIE